MPKDLTSRERDILESLARGLSDREISSSFDIAPSTLRTHLHSIFLKLDVANRTAAAHQFLTKRADDERKLR